MAVLRTRPNYRRVPSSFAASLVNRIARQRIYRAFLQSQSLRHLRRPDSPAGYGFDYVYDMLAFQRYAAAEAEKFPEGGGYHGARLSQLEIE